MLEKINFKSNFKGECQKSGIRFFKFKRYLIHLRRCQI
ncbi:hypothetical protein CAMSH0001_0673 [Campylobacter showae RM3277]|uniref:Uncharacterized protein n=1 Tax=Campylobacter showae RM3277 TaxID=553219 RepID=C6RGL7_9BACT|nr:hypothetical protein CAMSH0001_0673 [Campylobacter showae RM3277]